MAINTSDIQVVQIIIFVFMFIGIFFYFATLKATIRELSRRLSFLENQQTLTHLPIRGFSGLTGIMGMGETGLSGATGINLRPRPSTIEDYPLSLSESAMKDLPKEKQSKLKFLSKKPKIKNKLTFISAGEK